MLYIYIVGRWVELKDNLGKLEVEWKKKLVGVKEWEVFKNPNISVIRKMDEKSIGEVGNDCIGLTQ